MQTPSNPSATQHPTRLPLLPPLMALTLDPASLQLHLQQPQASQPAVQAPTSSFLLQNLQLLEDQQEERGYSPLQVTKHDSLEDFERRLWSFPVEDQIQLLSELFSGYCTRNHGFHIWSYLSKECCSSRRVVIVTSCMGLQVDWGAFVKMALLDFLLIECQWGRYSTWWISLTADLSRR